MICVSAAARTVEEFLSAVEASRPYASLFELRVDLLEDLSGLDRLRGLRDSLVVTVRRASDGGAFSGTEGERLRLLTRVASELRPLYVDLEVGARRFGEVTARLRALGVGLIASSHDTSRTPGVEELRALREKALELGPDVVKLVTTARSWADNLTTLQVTAESRGVVSFCMGRLGLPSRVLAPAAGAPFTYASAPGFAATAPGQIDAGRVREIWRLLGL